MPTCSLIRTHRMFFCSYVFSPLQPFLAQLALRADLLNYAFQQAVAEVVLSHAAEAGVGPAALSTFLESSCLASGKCNKGSEDAVGLRVRCCFLERTGLVEIHPGPVKKLSRMREKLIEYMPPHPRGEWPLAANILDPVRASVVTNGPERIVQVVHWFLQAKERSVENGRRGLLEVCRIKNGFAQSRASVHDGYRDVKIFLLFTGPGGLKIIGEVQVNSHHKSASTILLSHRSIATCSGPTDPKMQAPTTSHYLLAGPVPVVVWSSCSYAM